MKRSLKRDIVRSSSAMKQLMLAITCKIILCLMLLLTFTALLLTAISASNIKVCSEFGFNWAAEIRCLRNLLTQCQEDQGPLSRGIRTVETSSSASGTFRFPYQHARLTQHYTKDSPRRTTSFDLDSLTANMTDIIEKRVAHVKHHLEREMHRKINALQSKLDEATRQNQMSRTVYSPPEDSSLSSIVRKNEADIRKLLKKLELFSARIHRHGHHEYIVVNDRESWYQAEEICLQWGGHLASVHSDDENRFLANILTVDSAWLGTNDVQRENIYVNADRTPTGYRNWAKDQPDNANHNENCVEMKKDGKWSDLLCLMRRPFLCKR